MEDNVVLFLDFENLALSADEVYPSKEKPLDIGPIMDFAASKGNLCIKKAYADWSYSSYSQYQKNLAEYGFELIHLPATTTQGKNGSDVRLAIDVMENMELFKTINVFIIGSGDTDFIPLIQRILARGKRVIILGFDHSVGSLLKKNCSEYKSIEELIGKPDEDSFMPEFDSHKEESDGKKLLKRYVKTRNDDGPILMTTLKQHLLRLDPSFSEKKLGYSSFKRFLESLKGEIVDKIEKGDYPGIHFVYLFDVNDSTEIETNYSEEAKKFLKKNIRYIKAKDKRLELCNLLFNEFKKKKEMSMFEMIDSIHSSYTLQPKPKKVEIRKFINTLFTAKTFIPSKNFMSGPLLSRPLLLNDSIVSPNELDQKYLNRVQEILESRYPTLSEPEINKIMSLG